MAYPCCSLEIVILWTTPDLWVPKEGGNLEPGPHPQPGTSGQGLNLLLFVFFLSQTSDL